MTDSTIEVGFIYLADLGAQGSARGQDVNDSPQPRMVPAMVDEINKTGGVAGRKLKAVGHAYQIGAGAYATEDQKACTALTQDHHVYIAFQGNTMMSTMAGCFAKRKTIAVTAPISAAAGTATFGGGPLYFEATSPHLNRVARTLADGLFAKGFYTSPSAARPFKLGLMRAESPDFDAAAAQYKAQLGTHKLKVSEECAIVASESVSDTARVVNQLTGCILRFNSAGVTHVTFLMPDAGGTQFFIKSAQAQRAHFRYGFTSNDAPQPQTRSQGVEKAQFTDAMSIGWTPRSDVLSEKARPVASGTPRCEAIAKKVGLVGADYTSDVAQVCDWFTFLQKTLGTEPRAIDASTFPNAVSRLTGGYPSALTFKTAFGPDRRWGAEEWRLGQYQAECNCFRYTGGLSPFIG